ncbi:MAG: uracil-DNA glycosylase [bacterium]
MNTDIKIEPEWKEVLKEYFGRKEFESLTEFVRQEYQTKKIFPEPVNIFKAFWQTPFSKVKVVILGQDPYHSEGQAQGLSFSVPVGVKVPPSLQNMYKEIENEFGIKKDFSVGDLEPWARQGVFLLNSVLTVVANSPASHKGKGWELFTDYVISKLSDQREGLVFMLWGNFAKGKEGLIDSNKHLVLKAPHPSPFSVHTGFYGCNHFKLCNQYLVENGGVGVEW